jgi:hypothetical protein
MPGAQGPVSAGLVCVSVQVMNNTLFEWLGIPKAGVCQMHIWVDTHTRFGNIFCCRTYIWSVVGSHAGPLVEGWRGAV